jgi:predicted enzyme related to lactoylglutathione lyase
MNLGFVVLYVRDMEKVKAFYTDILGLTVVESVSSPTFVTLRSDGGSLLALQDKAAAVMAPAHEDQPGNVELSFEVDDVNETWRRWKEQGVTVVADPVDLPFGRYFLAQDPEGHWLSAYRFAQHPAISPTDRG